MLHIFTYFKSYFCFPRVLSMHMSPPVPELHLNLWIRNAIMLLPQFQFWFCSKMETLTMDNNCSATPAKHVSLSLRHDSWLKQEDKKRVQCSKRILQNKPGNFVCEFTACLKKAQRWGCATPNLVTSSKTTSDDRKTSIYVNAYMIQFTSVT